MRGFFYWLAARAVARRRARSRWITSGREKHGAALVGVRGNRLIVERKTDVPRVG